MIKQMFKLIWNRKRANALIMVEIFFSFLMIFAVAVASVYLYSNYSKPLGYEYENVWNIAVDARETRTERESADLRDRMSRLVTELRTLDGVQSAAQVGFAPFDESVAENGIQHEGSRVYVQFNRGDAALDETLDLEVVRGRWFNSSDASGANGVVVIDEDTARTFFDNADPIGQKLISEDEEEIVGGRIVGVIRDFRRNDLEKENAYVFEPISQRDPDQLLAGNILVRLPAGTRADFEEHLIARLQAMEPAWSFEVRPLEQLRDANLRLRLVPLMIGAIVALFLSLTVALGLMGVLWQNVTQRTREIGLRRAIGAPAKSVQSQIVGELLVLTSCSLLAGAIAVSQLPLIGMVTLPAGVFITGLLISLGLIYLLAVSCALYPSWLASRVQPALALRTD